MFNAQLKIIFFMALRNIGAHKTKNILVGLLLLLGTFVVVAGTSIVDSMEKSMANSVVSSIGAHLQVYSSKGKDPLQLFGGMMMAREDIGNIPVFSKVKQALITNKNVQDVIPMALDTTLIATGNDLDKMLESVREAFKSNKNQEEINLLVRHLRETLMQIDKDLAKRNLVAKPSVDEQKAQADLQIVTKDSFWIDFNQHFDDKLYFIESNIVKTFDTYQQPMYVRYLATDLSLFAKNFNQFQLKSGEMIPDGKRGFLFNQSYYDELFKNRVAWHLDLVNEALQDGKTIAGDPKVRSNIEKAAKQYMQLILRLHPANMQEFMRNLRDMPLPASNLAEKTELTDLLKEFLTLTDVNFYDRYLYFYRTLTEHFRLYEISIGENIVLRTFTRSGYLKSVPVKIYGTFSFKGIEKSKLSGTTNLMDLMTFRDLYGALSEDNKAEIALIKAESGLSNTNLSSPNIEAELFNEDSKIEESNFNIEKNQNAKNNHTPTIAISKETSFSQTDIDQGLVLNGAVFLKDPSKLNSTKQELIELAKQQQLDLKIVDWQEASGVIGQFIMLIRGVLVGASFMIFLAALVIINNSMIISTLERTVEIGTMRAIGAQRNFVLTLFLFETLVLGVFSAFLGIICSKLLILFLHAKGIPAINDVFVFFFSGPRLYPYTSMQNIITGFGIILVVSLISSLYPAYIATRIKPITAMQAKE